MWRLAAVLAVSAAPLAADSIASAQFSDPTTRYAHGILGDATEWGGLEVEVTSADNSLTYRFDLPDNQVFEDLSPRLWDITGDGAPEVVVILTDVELGASLLVIGLVNGKPQSIATTPHIGQPHRWLAPIGAADLDGDGRVEVAYIDRPHLAKTLRIWEFDGTNLVLDAELAGLTNHRIGQDFISGGIRTCAGQPEVITANANWSRIMATALKSGTATARDIGPFTGQQSLANALNCQ